MGKLTVSALQKLVAAATRIITGKKSGSQSNSNGQSTLAWDHWETIPEVGAFASWISNAMSGAVLFAGVRGPDGEILPAPANSRASQLVASIAGGPEGQGVFLGESGTQQAVAGDQWVVIIPDPQSDDMSRDKWYVLSTEEVTVQRGKVKATVNGETVEIPEYDPDNPPGPDEPVYMRIWDPSPRRHQWATSPVIRAAVVLEELRLLNAAVAAIARSRITGRGLLLVPAGTRFPVQPGQDQAEDSLLDMFIEVASTAIREPESAAATVPIVLEVPGDLIAGVKWLQFASEFDSMALQLRDEAIRRFAAGADIPAEILLGMGDVNHWGAWALTAEALRMGAEPRLARVCQGLTQMWLQPILEAEGDPNASDYLIWYDTSGLRSSSNKGANAIEAFKQGIISAKAARRELGFTEADAPGVPDLTTVPNTARTADAVPSNLGGNLPVSATEQAPGQDAPAGSPRNFISASGGAQPAAGAVLDSFTADVDQAAVEAINGLVKHALTTAGRKMLNTPLVPRSFRADARAFVADGTVHVFWAIGGSDVARYRLLPDDVWNGVPPVANRYGMKPVALANALEEHVSGLLVSGQAHEYDDAVRLLARLKVGA